MFAITSIRRAILPVILAAGLCAVAVPATAAPVAAAPVVTPTVRNDYSCDPTPAAPQPVLLLHGTTDSTKSLDTLAATLAARGVCVFDFNYGPMWISVTGIYGVDDSVKSAHTVATNIDRILQSTGAAKVDVIGHSQGSVLALYYAKLLGGADKVDQLVGLGSTTHGTTMNGLVNLSNTLRLRKVVDFVMSGFCRACADQEIGSDMINALTAGPIAMPGVRYTMIATRGDATATPAGQSSFILEPGVRNIWVQDVCATSKVDHKHLPNDGVSMNMAIDALYPGTATGDVTRACAS